MNVDDFDHPSDHRPIRVEPDTQGAVDRLRAIFQTFSTSMDGAQQNLQIGEILTGTIDQDALRKKFEEVRDLRSLVKFLIEGGGGHQHKWSGLALCPACIRKSVFLLRDAADTLENLLAEVDKRADWPPVHEETK